jgi:hypothetical protein
MRIDIRLARADPGRDVSNATVFILCTYTSTKAIYKPTDISLIPSFHSPLLCSPLLVFSLLSLYPAELDDSAGSGRRCPPPLVHSSMAM